MVYFVKIRLSFPLRRFLHPFFTNLVTDVSYFGVTKIDYAHLSIQFVKDVVAKLNAGNYL